ncbi:MAG: hypothetical protein AAGF12_02575 [Myxococcota bacterium]
MRILYQDQRLQICVQRNMFAAGWFGMPELRHMHEVERCYEDLRSEWPDGVGFANVIVGGVPNFSREVREDAARQTAKGDEQDLATAHLILVDGLAGAAVRAFLSTMLLVGRSTVPNRVFSDCGVAAGWVAGLLNRVPPPWDATDMQRFLERVATQGVSEE